MSERTVVEGAPDLRDPSVIPPVVYFGPESLFRLRDVVVSKHTATAAMDLGPWASDEGRPIGAGAIGVLMDNVTGYALVTSRQPDTWTVSTEISVDAFPGLLKARELHAESTVIHTDHVGGFATARVFDENGELVAVGSQRSRWVPFDGTDMRGRDQPDLAPPTGGDLRTMLGARSHRDGADLVLAFTSRSELENPRKIMHGGISICAVDVAASAVLVAEGMPPLATSSLRLGYTRPVMDGDAVEYRATPHHRGRTLGIVEVRATVAGRTVAVAHVVANPLD